MSVTEIRRHPSQPVGHQGARVDIAQRRAVAFNGWFGVIVLAVCWPACTSAPSTTPPASGCPSSSSSCVATSLVIVPPGQTSVVQFFGRYVGTVSHAGLLVGASLSPCAGASACGCGTSRRTT